MQRCLHRGWWIQPVGIRCQALGIFKLMSSSWLLDAGWPHRCAWNGFRRHMELQVQLWCPRDCDGRREVLLWHHTYIQRWKSLTCSSCPSPSTHVKLPLWCVSSSQGLFFQTSTHLIWLITATVLIFLVSKHPLTDSEPGMKYLPYVFFPGRHCFRCCSWVMQLQLGGFGLSSASGRKGKLFCWDKVGLSLTVWCIIQHPFLNCVIFWQLGMAVALQERGSGWIRDLGMHQFEQLPVLQRKGFRMSSAYPEDLAGGSIGGCRSAAFCWVLLALPSVHLSGGLLLLCWGSATGCWCLHSRHLPHMLSKLSTPKWEQRVGDLGVLGMAGLPHGPQSDPPSTASGSPGRMGGMALKGNSLCSGITAWPVVSGLKGKRTEYCVFWFLFVLSCPW